MPLARAAATGQLSIDSNRTIVHIASMTRHELIQTIETAATRTGLAPATITGRAVGNSRLYKRLIAGGDCTTEIAGKVVSFIDHITQEGASQ